MLKALTRPFLGFVLNPKYEKKLIEINQFSSCVLSQEEVDLHRIDKNSRVKPCPTEYEGFIEEAFNYFGMILDKAT